MRLVNVEKRIYWLRGQKVMIDADLAELYGVETKRLKEQVKRNRSRFPEDFLVEMTMKETEKWLRSRSQIATLNKRGKNVKYRAFAFTEQGVAMLSSVLNSKRAIEVNIAIMRAFVKLREVAAAHQDLAEKIRELERRSKKHDLQFDQVWEALQELIAPSVQEPRKKIGFAG
ncbi:MAG: ORF6N domain-containing protein [Acidimicrobiia bacterium]|nr:ORF6N domain-containing protein [Acidimicrobiia bacterium]